MQVRYYKLMLSEGLPSIVSEWISRKDLPLNAHWIGECNYVSPEVAAHIEGVKSSYQVMLNG